MERLLETRYHCVSGRPVGLGVHGFGRARVTDTRANAIAVHANIFDALAANWGAHVNFIGTHAPIWDVHANIIGVHAHIFDALAANSGVHVSMIGMHAPLWDVHANSIGMHAHIFDALAAN